MEHSYEQEFPCLPSLDHVWVTSLKLSRGICLTKNDWEYKISHSLVHLAVREISQCCMCTWYKFLDDLSFNLKAKLKIYNCCLLFVRAAWRSTSRCEMKNYAFTKRCITSLMFLEHDKLTFKIAWYASAPIRCTTLECKDSTFQIRSAQQKHIHLRLLCTAIFNLQILYKLTHTFSTF